MILSHYTLQIIHNISQQHLDIVSYLHIILFVIFNAILDQYFHNISTSLCNQLFYVTKLKGMSAAI